jgi:multicomponent Na+:H+ antiporter subunit E
VVLAQSLHYQTVLTGLVVSVLVTLINGDLLLSLTRDLHVKPATVAMWLSYLFFLVIEIITAALQVSKLAFSLRPKLSPGFVPFASRLREPMMRVVLANSITLTPGTLTVEAPLEGNLLIHVLTEEAAAGLNDWHIEQRLISLERKL